MGEETGLKVKHNYDAFRKYINKKGFNLDLGEFVSREPRG